MGGAIPDVPYDKHTGVAAAYKVPFPVREEWKIDSQDESWYHFVLSVCYCCRVLFGLDRPYPANYEEVADEYACWREMKI